ncbi:MAG TPA: ABC transporter permease [Thermoplasmata archaeon]|nr:ABC transporter permease [Thermoplasmata archaeon]
MAMRPDFRTFKNAAWLGWQMEANWTDPFLFAVYSIVRPIAGTLILVFIYMVAGGESDGAYFTYMYLGNAFYMFVADVLFGVTWVIHDDREHYMTLKQVYIAPISFYSYILGRAAIKIAITAVGVIITLIFGVLALGLDLSLGTVDWLLFLPAFVTGLACISILGLALGGVTFLTAKHSIGINEGLAGIFYVMSGVVFPITVLPSWVQGICKLLPVTHWMEAMRRGLTPQTMDDFAFSYGYDVTGMGSWSDITLIGALFVSTLVFLVMSLGIFRFADRLARKQGKIDWTTAY